MPDARFALTSLAALALCAAPAAAFASPHNSAQSLVNDSNQRLSHLESRNPKVTSLLKKAKAVFIIPNYGQGGLIVGGRGGQGVVLVRQPNGVWSDPAFYSIGGVNIGAQAGGANGPVVMFLMTQNALNDVMGSNNFSLNAKAGLSIVNYSAKSQAGWGRADAILWSNMKGAYAGATVGISDINQDQKLDRAYYGPTANVNEILHGQVRNPAASGLVRTVAA